MVSLGDFIAVIGSQGPGNTALAASYKILTTQVLCYYTPPALVLTPVLGGLVNVY